MWQRIRTESYYEGVFRRDPAVQSQLHFMRLQFKNRWAHLLQHALLRRGRSRSLRNATQASTLPIHADWDEAFLRVESYLRAHHIESRVLLNRLTSDILNAAQVLYPEQAGEAPVTLAIRVAQARIGEWLVHALGEGDWADERFRARGRLALLMAEIPQKHPEYFLASRELPGETKVRLATAKLLAGPDVRLAGMPPAPLEFPITEAVEERWTTFSRSTFFRASMSWLVIGTLASIVWLATR